ncbi:acyltransferase [Bacillus sp. BGMRC 2118]|nr:acyltransferase [Bacillus sp. BGMRC 2118]
MKNNSVTINRQYDMDWIRVIATMGVFLYHCLMFVNPFPWHVKNGEVDSGGILLVSLFLGSWMMPIFFAVSGISAAYALKKRNVKEYVKERVVRLGVPLVFGVFILSPPQVYMERLANNQFHDSFFLFFPKYFEGVYLDFGGTGNFAFFGLHLWFLLVLLLFSILTIPLFRFVPRITKLRLSHFFVLPILLFVSGIVKTQGLGGYDLIFYLIIFIYGYYFFSSDGFKPALRSSVKIHFILAILTSVMYIVWFMNAFPLPGTVQDMFFYAVKILNCWSLVLCIFYLADRYLSFSNDFLNYAGEASMPFYVLHQPVIVILCYFIKGYSWSIPAKLLFLLPVSFSLIMLCYHFLIRRYNVLRLLFGMKGTRKITTKENLNSTYSLPK